MILGRQGSGGEYDDDGDDDDDDDNDDHDDDDDDNENTFDKEVSVFSVTLNRSNEITIMQKNNTENVN